MTERVEQRYYTLYDARRRYLWNWMLWLLVSLSVGAMVALAEYCCWLPRRFSGMFSFAPQTIAASIGLLLAQTAPIPLIFLAGLYQASFYYTSHLLGFSFCFWHGLDIWKYLFVMKHTPKHSPAAVFALALLLLGMMCVIFHTLVVAAEGVRCQGRPRGMSLSAYLTSLFECWGAMMLFQAGFYLIYRWFLQ